MGISVELFRIRIGNFNGMKGKIKYISNQNLKPDLRKCKINISVLMIFSVLILQLTAYSWAQTGLSTNKFQKIINGNRRAVDTDLLSGIVAGDSYRKVSLLNFMK